MLAEPLNLLTLILGILTLASAAGTVAGVFYGVRQKTIITTLRESNDAYKERNQQLETQLATTIKENSDKIAALEGKVETLEKIKTPPLQPLIKLVTDNHKEVMKAINPNNSKKEN